MPAQQQRTITGSRLAVSSTILGIDAAEIHKHARMFLFDRRVLLASFHRQEDLRSMDQRSRELGNFSDIPAREPTTIIGLVTLLLFLRCRSSAGDARIFCERTRLCTPIRIHGIAISGRNGHELFIERGRTILFFPHHNILVLSACDRVDDFAETLQAVTQHDRVDVVCRKANGAPRMNAASSERMDVSLQDSFYRPSHSHEK